MTTGTHWQACQSSPTWDCAEGDARYFGTVYGGQYRPAITPVTPAQQRHNDVSPGAYQYRPTFFVEVLVCRACGMAVGHHNAYSHKAI